MVLGHEAHFGVDNRTELIHAVVATPANVVDSAMLPNLVHGEETRVWGDQAYRGHKVLIRQHVPEAKDFINRRFYLYQGALTRAQKRTLTACS